MAPPDLDAQKRAAAESAADLVEPGMLVGLGSGTTAAWLIETLGAKVRDGLAIRAVATSRATEGHAARVGIALLEMDDVAAVDLCIDGVDAIDPRFRAIKGGGGAMLREKIVAAAAARMVAIADASKPVATLAGRAIPIEVLPFARASVVRHLRDLGATATRRPAPSDQGNLLLDCRFDAPEAPEAIAAALDRIPGLLGHGLFLDEIDTLYVGAEAGVHATEASALRN